MPSYPKVAIIGVGLLGGSVGLALREQGLATHIVGVGRRQVSLERALECAAINEATTDLADGVADANLVIVATPVAAVVDTVSQVLAAAPPDALITDVGSTKAGICAAIDELANHHSRFVGSHPLAGDHRSGPEHARSDLFCQKVVVVTPTPSTSERTCENIQQFWEALGSRVLSMSPEQHDQALATTSHLPHLVASALAASTPNEWLPLAASGWADTTRVAASDPELWTQIFSQNTPELLAALDGLIEQLQSARSNLLETDTAQLKDLLERAKRTRDALGN